MELAPRIVMSPALVSTREALGKHSKRHQVQSIYSSSAPRLGPNGGVIAFAVFIKAGAGPGRVTAGMLHMTPRRSLSRGDPSSPSLLDLWERRRAS